MMILKTQKKQQKQKFQTFLFVENPPPPPPPPPPFGPPPHQTPPSVYLFHVLDGDNRLIALTGIPFHQPRGIGIISTIMIGIGFLILSMRYQAESQNTKNLVKEIV